MQQIDRVTIPSIYGIFTYAFTIKKSTIHVAKCTMHGSSRLYVGGLPTAVVTLTLRQVIMPRLLLQVPRSFRELKPFFSMEKNRRND